MNNSKLHTVIICKKKTTTKISSQQFAGKVLNCEETGVGLKINFYFLSFATTSIDRNSCLQLQSIFFAFNTKLQIMAMLVST